MRVIMRCVYLGLPKGAIALANAGHDIRVVGLSRRCPQRSLGVAPSCPILFRPDMNEPALQHLFATAGADLFLCYLWDRILPQKLFEAFTAVLNYHPSILPRHRGADPTFWTIWSGDEVTGVSIIQLDAGIDTGPILAQRTVSVPAGAHAGELSDLLDPLGLKLLLEVVSRWEHDGPIVGSAQDQVAATEAPAPNDDLLEIRWSWPSERIARLIRAAAPHPGTFTALDVDGELKTLVVLGAHPYRSTLSQALAPGDATITEEGVMIGTGDGALMLDIIQFEGEERRREAQAIVELFSNLGTFRKQI